MRAHIVTLFGSPPKVAMYFRIHLRPWRSNGRQSETEDLVLFWWPTIVQSDVADPGFLDFFAR